MTSNEKRRTLSGLASRVACGSQIQSISPSESGASSAYFAVSDRKDAQTLRAALAPSMWARTKLVVYSGECGQGKRTVIEWVAAQHQVPLTTWIASTANPASEDSWGQTQAQREQDDCLRWLRASVSSGAPHIVALYEMPVSTVPDTSSFSRRLAKICETNAMWTNPLVLIMDQDARGQAMPAPAVPLVSVGVTCGVRHKERVLAEFAADIPDLEVSRAEVAAMARSGAPLGQLLASLLVRGTGEDTGGHISLPRLASKVLYSKRSVNGKVATEQPTSYRRMAVELDAGGYGSSPGHAPGTTVATLTGQADPAAGRVHNMVSRSPLRAGPLVGLLFDNYPAFFHAPRRAPPIAATVAVSDVLSHSAILADAFSGNHMVDSLSDTIAQVQAAQTVHLARAGHGRVGAHRMAADPARRVTPGADRGALLAAVGAAGLSAGGLYTSFFIEDGLLSADRFIDSTEGVLDGVEERATVCEINVPGEAYYGIRDGVSDRRMVGRLGTLASMIQSRKAGNG